MKRVSILDTGNRFYLPQNIQTDSVAHPASCARVLKTFPREKSGWDMKINTHIISVSMLGMSAVILPFPNTPSCSVKGKI
jgi:hypothetical protein